MTGGAGAPRNWARGTGEGGGAEHGSVIKAFTPAGCHDQGDLADSGSLENLGLRAQLTGRRYRERVRVVDDSAFGQNAFPYGEQEVLVGRCRGGVVAMVFPLLIERMVEKVETEAAVARQARNARGHREEARTKKQ